MTLFEYIAIAFSMVASFTVLRALSGVPHAIQRERRYWVHLTWLGSTLATVLLMFWGFWWARDVEWNIITFAWALLLPGVLYVFVSLLVPQDPSTVTSWKQHFYTVRHRLFVTAIAWDITGAFTGPILTGGEIYLPVAFVFAGALAIHSVGAISRKPTVHAIIVLVPPAMIAILGLTIFFQPEALEGLP